MNHWRILPFDVALTHFSFFISDELMHSKELEAFVTKNEYSDTFIDELFDQWMTEDADRLCENAASAV